MEEETILGGMARSPSGNIEPETPEGPRGPRARKEDQTSFKIGIGRTVHLPRRIVEQALVAHVGRVLASRGLEAPDPIDFLNRASVHLEATGEAIVTWEE